MNRPDFPAVPPLEVFEQNLTARGLERSSLAEAIRLAHARALAGDRDGFYSLVHWDRTAFPENVDEILTGLGFFIPTRRPPSEDEVRAAARLDADAWRGVLGAEEFRQAVREVTGAATSGPSATA